MYKTTIPHLLKREKGNSRFTVNTTLWKSLIKNTIYGFSDISIYIICRHHNGNGWFSFSTSKYIYLLRLLFYQNIHSTYHQIG
jgi:hypothetical protein